MNKRKINPDLSRALGLVLRRFDRVEQLIASIAQETFDGDELLDSRDIRVLTKLSDRTILRRRKDGTLPYFRHSGKIYYRKSAVLKVIQQTGENPFK